MKTMSPKTTTLETTLFNALQFLLTVGFAWFSSRSISKSEFEYNLRKYAISAYRRITDIERMTHRLQGELANMIAENNSNNSSDLRVVHAMARDNLQVIKSSIDDWVDVIGDDLIAVEKIKRLEREKEDINTMSNRSGTNDEIKNQLDALEVSINELKSNLPSNLRVVTDSEKEKEFSINVKRSIYWFKKLLKKNELLSLEVLTGKGYGIILDQEKYKEGHLLTLKTDEERGIDILDAKNQICGRVLNPLPSSYKVFQQALSTLLVQSNTPVILASPFVYNQGRNGDLMGYSIVINKDQIIQQEL